MSDLPQELNAGMRKLLLLSAWGMKSGKSSKEKNGVLWTLPRAYECTRADMPTADSIAVDSIPSFKPEPELFENSNKSNSWRIRSQIVLLILKSQIIVSIGGFSFCMKLSVLKIAYSWYSLPNSLFYSEFLLNVVHSLAFGWGKSSSLPNLPKRRYSLKQ